MRQIRPKLTMEDDRDEKGNEERGTFKEFDTRGTEGNTSTEIRLWVRDNERVRTSKIR